jgi:hypothetical protein
MRGPGKERKREGARMGGAERGGAERSEKGMTYMVMRREKTEGHAAAASTTSAAAAPSAGTCTLCKLPQHTSSLLTNSHACTHTHAYTCVNCLHLCQYLLSPCHTHPQTHALSMIGHARMHKQTQTQTTRAHARARAHTHTHRNASRQKITRGQRIPLQSSLSAPHPPNFPFAQFPPTIRPLQSSYTRSSYTGLIRTSLIIPMPSPFVSTLHDSASVHR